MRFGESQGEPANFIRVPRQPGVSASFLEPQPEFSSGHLLLFYRDPTLESHKQKKRSKPSYENNAM